MLNRFGPIVAFSEIAPRIKVDRNFDKYDMPYDVLWLDIEHTDGKRYFTWDNRHFKDPTKMIEDLSSRGRKMVTIVDPHIKVDNNYHVYKGALFTARVLDMSKFKKSLSGMHVSDVLPKKSMY